MYIDLVLCKHPVDTRTYLVYAPKWTRFKEGDEVVVETVRGEQPATVLESITVDPKDEEYRFIVKAMDATEPLKKVLKKVRYSEMDFKDDDYLQLFKEENDGTVND